MQKPVAHVQITDMTDHLVRKCPICGVRMHVVMYSYYDNKEFTGREVMTPLFAKACYACGTQLQTHDRIEGVT